jgi:NAD(P)-dependent dehydrogenase (short-subunit alcohol dehydrogenase family)
MNLKGKCALVTDGTKGIGAVVTGELLRKNVTVYYDYYYYFAIL